MGFDEIIDLTADVFLYYYDIKPGMDDSFCSILFDSVLMYQCHAYLTPLSMRDIYSIRAQNGYGQHRP